MKWPILSYRDKNFGVIHESITYHGLWCTFARICLRQRLHLVVEWQQQLSIFEAAPETTNSELCQFLLSLKMKRNANWHTVKPRLSRFQFSIYPMCLSAIDVSFFPRCSFNLFWRGYGYLKNDYFCLCCWSIAHALFYWQPFCLTQGGFDMEGRKHCNF